MVPRAVSLLKGLVPAFDLPFDGVLDTSGSLFSSTVRVDRVRALATFRFLEPGDMRPTMSGATEGTRRKPRLTCRNAFVLTYRPAEGESNRDTRDGLFRAFGGLATVYMRDSNTPTGTERKVFLWTEKRHDVQAMWFTNRERKGYLRGRVTEVLYPAERQKAVLFWEQAIATMEETTMSASLLGSFTSLVESYRASRAKMSSARREKKRPPRPEPKPGGTGDTNLPADTPGLEPDTECFMCGTHSNGKPT